MSDITQKKQELLEVTKHTEDNSIIEERIVNRINGDTIRRYTRGKLLGKGGFAKCYEVTCVETKKISAIKIVNKQTLKKAKAKQKLITEIKIHKTLKHRRIVAFDHVFEDNQNVYILLELCSNNTLNDILKKRKRLTQYEVQYFISQLIEGLAFIHSAKVIHRDLKLGNLLMTQSMQMKIGDFGLAAKIQAGEQKKKTVCGTPNYIAPEILEGKGHSYEVDIWSTGVILYALLYGRPPFETSDVKKTYKKIKQCQYIFPQEVSVSTNAKNLINRLLVVDPVKRLTLSQIRNHPFLSEAKIPSSLPLSITQEAPQKTYIDSQIRRKTTQKIVVEDKLHSGISDRLLLRSSSGMSRNYFMKLSSYKNSNPRITSNNFITSNNLSLPQSNKHAKEMIINSNLDTVFVKKWVDYSSKYGLGYLLSNRSTGIYFNDSSKMIVQPNGENIDYITSSGELMSYSGNQPPENRQVVKKITLMQYFGKYLNGSSSTNLKEEFSETEKLVYIKKWAKSENGIIFRLNNKVLQINFADKSQMVIYGEKNVGVFSAVKLGKQKIFFQLNGSETKHVLLHKKMQQTGKLLKLLVQKRDKKEKDIQEKQALIFQDL